MDTVFPPQEQGEAWLVSVTSEARVLPSAPALRAGQGICVRARGLLLRGLFLWCWF